jgi:hypothetical protein
MKDAGRVGRACPYLGCGPRAQHLRFYPGLLSNEKPSKKRQSALLLKGSKGARPIHLEGPAGPGRDFGLAKPASAMERNAWRVGNAKRETVYSSLTDLKYPTRALTGLPVKARVWFLIVHPGSRAQHLQNRYRRLNGGAHWQASRRVAILRVFSGDFAVRMSALRESAR